MKQAAEAIWRDIDAGRTQIHSEIFKHATEDLQQKQIEVHCL